MKIDSLTKFDELISAGMMQDEARVLAHSLSSASETDLSFIATKEDIRGIEKEVRGIEKEMKGIEKHAFYFGVLIFSCLAYLMFVK